MLLVEQTISIGKFQVQLLVEHISTMCHPLLLSHLFPSAIVLPLFPFKSQHFFLSTNQGGALHLCAFCRQRPLGMGCNTAVWRTSRLHRRSVPQPPVPRCRSRCRLSPSLFHSHQPDDGQAGFTATKEINPLSPTAALPL